MRIQTDTTILERSSERLHKLIGLNAPACIVLGEITLLYGELAVLAREVVTVAQVDHDELMEWRANKAANAAKDGV